MAFFYGISPRNQRDMDVTNDVYLRDSGQQALCPPESSNMMMYFNFQPPKYSNGPFSQLLASTNNDCESIMNEHGTTAYCNDIGDGDKNNNNIDALSSGSFHNHGGGGLSLSLATQIPMSASSFHSDTYSIFSPPHRQSQSSDHETHNFDSCVGLVDTNLSVNSSKYLKAAQNLLDEIVNVHKVTFKQKAAVHKKHHELTMVSGLNNNTTKDNDVISPSEKQELQNKVTQLLAMLDEVDRRYKQYNNQMQMIVSSFDTIAGCGAARPYTALALQTISRHFRCLRDAINNQIQSARKTLGEEESLSTKGCAGISRLRYIDQHLRQQRAAMQQLGIMQPHAWRPQRGLPESSVSLLRAWLFEHFLHPYPNDSEKLMLARQTGLTRGQVSNWFINARVRLWKPMIEEMYKEEFGEGGEILESNSSSENTNKMKMDDDNKGSCELLDGEDGSCDQGPTDQYDDDIEEIMVGAGYNNGSSSALIEDERRRFTVPYNNINSCTALGLTLGLQQGEDQAMISSSSAAHLYNNSNDNNTVQSAFSLGGFRPPPASHLLHEHFVASSN